MGWSPWLVFFGVRVRVRFRGREGGEGEGGVNFIYDLGGWWVLGLFECWSRFGQVSGCDCE